MWETQGEGGGAGGGQLGFPSFQGDDAVWGDTHGMLWGGSTHAHVCPCSHAHALVGACSPVNAPKAPQGGHAPLKSAQISLGSHQWGCSHVGAQ